ncbi:MAG: DUF1294 domain-containing protein [Opitutaceae bacterium]
MHVLTDIPLIWVFWWYGAWSLVTLVVYGWDKRAAGKSRWRVPERRLHLLAAVGGIPGAILAQQVFRHKNRKAGFQFVTGWIVAVHIILMVMYFWKRSGN